MVGMELFGDKLKTIRKAKKMTQVELSRELGVSTSVIAAYEQGKNFPSVSVLIEICKILRVSSDYLLGISDEISIKLGGLSDDETQAFLQLIGLFEENRKLRDGGKIATSD